MSEGKSYVDIYVAPKYQEIGIQGHAQYCPIGRAAADAVPAARSVYVTRDTIEFRFKGNIRRSFPLPEIAREYQVQYDTWHKVYDKAEKRELPRPIAFSVPLIIDFPVDPPPGPAEPEPPKYKG